MVCQEELAKALQIASEFREKLSEEEGIKQDMLNELLSERSSKTKQLQVEQGKVSELAKENDSLIGKMEKFELEKAALIRENSDASKKSNQDLEKANQSLKNVLLQLDDLRGKMAAMQDERSNIETTLHSFYTSQIEEILAEKIDSLQENVHKWEKNLMRDKQEALTIMENDYERQLDLLRKKVFEDVSAHYESQIKVLQAALDASRGETDALRRQVLSVARDLPDSHININQQKKLPVQADHDLEAKERRERIWKEILEQSSVARSHIVQNDIQMSRNVLTTSKRKNFEHTSETEESDRCQSSRLNNKAVSRGKRTSQRFEI